MFLIDPELIPDNCSECTSTVSVSQHVTSIKSAVKTRKEPKRLQTPDQLLFCLAARKNISRCVSCMILKWSKSTGHACMFYCEALQGFITSTVDVDNKETTLNYFK